MMVLPSLSGWTWTGIVLLLALISAGMPGGGRAAEVNLLGQVALPNIGFITDVWGYVDPISGREYALVGNRINQQGFHIIDVTTPGSAFVVSQAAPDVWGFDLKVFDHYVYSVTGGAGSGGRIVDISNVFAPVVVRSISSAHNVAIDPRGLLIMSSAGTVREVQVWDLREDPTNPGFVWRDNLSGAHDTSVIGTRLFDFHGTRGTRIYDFAEPANPVLLGVVTDPAIIFHHSGYTTEDGNYLFIADEGARHPTPDITVWDIRDVSNPVKVAEVADPIAIVHNLYIVGDFAYVSHYTSGFKVFDVSDPTNPQLAGSFDTSAMAGEVFGGNFGVYPFAPSGNIYVSDDTNGLYVFSFTPDASAVLITSFDVEYEAGAVHMRWVIGEADGLTGFHIYRSLESDRGFVRINENPLSSEGVFEFVDTAAPPARTVWYRLGAVDRDGEFFSVVKRVRTPERQLKLGQNVPNPFNPSTTIRFEIPSSATVTLIVFNLQGQRVTTLVNGVRPAGAHTVVWNGTDDAGHPVASGAYFYRIETNGHTESKRMILLK